jgi:hypothetical protein
MARTRQTPRPSYAQNRSINPSHENGNDKGDDAIDDATDDVMENWLKPLSEKEVSHRRQQQLLILCLIFWQLFCQTFVSSSH